MGLGDAFCSYLPEAVKRIGLWDERFCNIGYQDGDYFLRSLIYNHDKSSINDIGHGREHNALAGNSGHLYPTHLEDETKKSDSLLITTPQWNPDRKDAHISSLKVESFSEAVFMHKWGITDGPWTPEHFAVRKPLAPSYVMYPYFEKDVESLSEKFYIVPDEGRKNHWETAAVSLSESVPATNDEETSTE